LVWVLHACMERGGTTDTTNYGETHVILEFSPGCLVAPHGCSFCFFPAQLSFAGRLGKIDPGTTKREYRRNCNTTIVPFVYTLNLSRGIDGRFIYISCDCVQVLLQTYMDTLLECFCCTSHFETMCFHPIFDCRVSDAWSRPDFVAHRIPKLLLSSDV
jgi:hypothetical protein